MKPNTYKLVTKIKKAQFALTLALLSCMAYAQTTYTFNYTGGQQTISLPAGSYSIQCWGGNGGAGGNAAPPLTGTPGIGGYSSGTFSAAANTTLFVNVAGKGQSTNTSGAQAAVAPGGWNGGGSGWNGASNANYKGGGGGATHVATVAGTLASLASNTSAVIIVAGGGGGAGGSTGTPLTWVGSGGNGGGLVGQDGVLAGSQTSHNGKGGTQTAGGAGGVNGTYLGVAGSFGLGGNGGGTGNTFPAGGGGAGWYGGGGGATQGGGGAGGSSYIGGVTSGTTIMFGQPGFVPNPDATGNGMALITELCSITLAHNGAGTSNVAQLCAGQSLTLTTNAVANYSWSTGATTSSLVVSPTTNTVYSLSATSPAACLASRSLSVAVFSGQPTLTVISSTNQTCAGKTATLTASGAITYTWTNGVVNGVSFFPSATQTYTVSGQNGCGIVTAVSTISVLPLPVSIASTHTAVCTNKTSTLSVTAPATSYTLNPGNLVSTNNSFIVNPQINTVFTVAVSDGTCLGYANVSLQANPVPTISVLPTSTLMCAGETVTLSATGGNNYTWSPGNQSGSTITVSPTSSTLYGVAGDNSFGCSANSSQVIVVGAQPTLVVAIGNSTICDGGSTTLTASGANSYAWMGGPTTNSYLVSPNQNTTYTVVGTNSSSGCTDMKTISISVFSPSLAITGNTVICNGASSNLSATGGVSYTWEPGGLPFQGITVSPTSNSIYTVNSIANQGALNCPASATIEITVNPTPTVTAVANPTAICPKQTATITANGASTYTWVSTNTTIVNSSIKVTASSASVLVYTITGMNAQGCESSISIPFNVSACTGMLQEAFDSGRINIYPNPNNGDFTIAGENEMELKLINELGQVVQVIHLSNNSVYNASVSNLSNGIYFLVNANFRHKIIVSK